MYCYLVYVYGHAQQPAWHNTHAQDVRLRWTTCNIQVRLRRTYGVNRIGSRHCFFFYGQHLPFFPFPSSGYVHNPRIFLFLLCSSFFPSGLFHNDYDTAAVDSYCFVVLRCIHARTRARADVETVLVIPSTQLTPSPLDLSGNRGGRHHHFYHYHPSNDEQHMCICARSRADSMNCHEGPHSVSIAWDSEEAKSHQIRKR